MYRHRESCVTTLFQFVPRGLFLFRGLIPGCGRWREGRIPGSLGPGSRTKCQKVTKVPLFLLARA